MTTGRINQIPYLAGAAAGREAQRRGPGPPEGTRVWIFGRGGEPPDRDGPPAYRGAAGDHPIAPTKPLNTGPRAGVPTVCTLAGGGWLRHAVIGWRTPPADTLDRAVPAGGAASRNLGDGMASGHASTDSSSAGGLAASGLRVPGDGGHGARVSRREVPHRPPGLGARRRRGGGEGTGQAGKKKCGDDVVSRRRRLTLRGCIEMGFAHLYTYSPTIVGV